MPNLQTFTLFLLALLFWTPESSKAIEVSPTLAETIFIHTGTDLYEFDVESKKLKHVGKFSGAVFVTDIAIGKNGEMYGLEVNQSSSTTTLIEINPKDAKTKNLYAISGIYNALESDSDGKLFAGSASGSGVFELNIEKRTTTYVGGKGYRSSGDLLSLSDGKLLWSVIGGKKGDSLVEIDTSSKKSNLSRETEWKGIFGLASYEGKAVLFTVSGDSAGKAESDLEDDRGFTIVELPAKHAWYGATSR